MPITANVSMASLASVSRNGLLNNDTESALATDWTNRLRIKTASIAAPVVELSGGNQQKVAIARWLATDPEVLILDEPTQGVDIGSKSEIHDIVNSAAARGCAVIMISSELPEILGMSDRIAVMHEGAIAGTLTREEATQEKVLALAMGQA
jgi:rhamnose transport system ATP-binding protein